VILARSFMPRLVSCRHQHAGNQARQDLERRTAREFVELFPKARCEARPKRPPGGSGWSEKSRFSCTTAPPLCGADLDRSAAESADEMAQLKQITKAAQCTRTEVGFPTPARPASG